MGVRRRPDASPTRPAQSTDRVNPEPETPGWTKRLRLEVHHQTEHHVPLEEVLWSSRFSNRQKNLLKSVVRPALGLSFDSLGEAYDFCNLYFWEIGFGIRYGKSSLNANRTKSMQEIVCGCSGNPEAENSRL